MKKKIRKGLLTKSRESKEKYLNGSSRFSWTMWGRPVGRLAASQGMCLCVCWISWIDLASFKDKDVVKYLHHLIDIVLKKNTHTHTQHSDRGMFV